MRRPCEICAERDEAKTSDSDLYVLIENRVVALCDRHASAVKKLRIKTLDQLRDHFQETTGVRSLVPRRAVNNRRLFPARPEGRRRSDGRRWDDSLNDG
jgi:hypothetical protein